MKTISTLLFCLFAGFCHAQLPSDTLLRYMTFEKLGSFAEGYGTIEKPIGSGAFKNISDMNNLRARMAKLENSYRWPDGSKIDFSKRGSTQGKNGIVDRYTLENKNTKTIIQLYVDPYKQDSIFYIPKGLIANTVAFLAKDLEGPLKNIDDILKDNDVFANQQNQMNDVASFIAKNVSIGYFVDRENLAKVMTDTQAAGELKDYLFKIYILNKFYALGKNIDQPNDYALKQLKVAFANFQKMHPDVESGNIKINLNE